MSEAISARTFAACLLFELDKGFDLKRLADWADSYYFKYAQYLDNESSAILERIFLSTYGNQTITEVELLDSVISLIETSRH